MIDGRQCRRGHGNGYGEGPQKRRSIHKIVCEECGVVFECVDEKAKKCPRCLGKDVYKKESSLT